MKGVNAFRIYFMVIGLFALAVFTIYSFSSLTGNVVLAQCTDSDSSLVSSYPEEGSIYVKGVVVGLSSVGDGNTISKEDYCTTNSNCCNSVDTGGNIYCSLGLNNDVNPGGCCPTGWYMDPIEGVCIQAAACLSCTNDPSLTSYWTDSNCFRFAPTPYEQGCCTINNFGLPGKYFASIKVYDNQGNIVSG